MSRVVQLFASLALLCCLSGFGLPQTKWSAEDQAKLALAEKEAARFVERFRRTLDFGIVWKELHSSNKSCPRNSIPDLPMLIGNELVENDRKDRFKEIGSNDWLLNRIYVSSWNLFFLESAFIYSQPRPKSASVPEDMEPIPKTMGMKRIERADAKSKYGIGVSSKVGHHREPHSAREFEEYIAEMDRFAALFRKYMPRNALKSAKWRSTVKWMARMSPVNNGGVVDGDENWCLTKKDKIYVPQIGPFYFAFREENGKMKLLTVVFNNN